MKGKALRKHSLHEKTAERNTTVMCINYLLHDTVVFIYAVIGINSSTFSVTIALFDREKSDRLKRHECHDW